MWIVKRLYQFIFQYPIPFVVGTLAMAIGLALGNAAPFFVKWITQAVQNNQADQAVGYVALFGLSLLLSNVFENIGYFVSDKNMVATSTLIAQSVLAHIHNLDFAYHTNKSSGKLISLMKRGDDAYFAFYDIFNRQFLSIALSFGIMLGAFFQLQLHYLVFVLALIVLTCLISLVLVKVNIKKRDLFNTADDELSSARVDNLVNFDTVKYFANEAYEQKRFSGLLSNWDKTLQSYFFTFRYFDGILGNLVNVALVGIMFLGIYDLRRGSITLAEFLLITTFSMTLFPRMMNFLFTLRELAKRHSDLKEYFTLLDEPVSVVDPTEPVALPHDKGEIVFDNVTFYYDKEDTPVLKNFTLTIRSGEAVALVGYSGAGKTTIAKLLMRMYDPQSGSIQINGVDIRQVTKSTLRSLVGIVPQDPLLFNNTVQYNIAYAKNQALKEEIIEAAQEARVSDFIGQLPNGYETIVGERGIKLSGGQRQRLAIARVLLERPEILVFDEATSALDSASERTIQASFWNLVRNVEHPRTAIIIAHRLSTIMRADRIVVMDKGTIVDVGTHAELMAKPNGIYYTLWSLQRDGFIGDDEVTFA